MKKVMYGVLEQLAMVSAPCFDNKSNAPLRGAEVYCVSIVSASAVKPNTAKHSHSQETIMTTITQCVKRVWQYFALHNHRTIVLGVWGCGVFGNIRVIARLFVYEVFGQCTAAWLF
jgi:uncharacterized protein (TIGR02452 family)